MFLSDEYSGGQHVDTMTIRHEGQAVIACTLLVYDKKDVGFSVIVEDCEPFIRSRWVHQQGDKHGWDALCMNIRDLLYLAHEDNVHNIPIIMPQTLAILYDNKLRDVLGRACGEKPVFKPDDVNKAYIYKLA